MTHVFEPILDRAYDAIMAGSFETLGLIYAELDAFAPPKPLTLQEATRLKSKAARNANGLEAALNGLRSAKRRIAEIARANTFSTYDSEGRISAVHRQTVQVSRKF